MPGVNNSKSQGSSRRCFEKDKHTEIWKKAMSEVNQKEVVRYMNIPYAKHSKADLCCVTDA